MSKKKNRTIFSVFTSVVAFIALSSGPLHAATLCTCNDICDVENAAVVARAAQWEYQMQIQILNDIESHSGSAIWYGPLDYRDNFRPKIQKRINDFAAVCNPPLNRNAGATDGGSCEITVEPTSACMTEFVFAHESVHYDVCRSFTHFFIYQMSASMADFFGEEIRGYQTSIDMYKSLTDSTNGVLKDCCCKSKCTPSGPGVVVGTIDMLKRIVKNLLS